MAVEIFASTEVPVIVTSVVPVISAPPAEVPEPATLVLLGMGLAGLGLVRRRSQK